MFNPTVNLGSYAIRRGKYKNCLMCGKEFYIHSKGSQKYCSVKCSDESHIGRIPWNKGLTKETDRRVRQISENQKGNIPWNKGKKGLQVGWNKGLTKEIDKRVRKISESKKGMKVTWGNKVSQTRKRLFKEGKLKVWHDGKTKETDNRVRKKMEKLSITRKKLIKEGKLNPTKNLPKDLKGENNPAWRGGISFEPYGLEFNNKLKKQIRQRDNFTCQECHFTEEQLGRKLDVHHIDFNKKNNHPNNLISLCNSCHTQAQFNREDWTNYFQDKIQGRT